MVNSYSRATVLVVTLIIPHAHSKNIFDAAHGILKPTTLTAKAARKTLELVEPLVPSSEAQLGIHVAKGALKVAETGAHILDTGAQKLSKRHGKKQEKPASTHKHTKAERPESAAERAERLQHIREARLKYFLGEEPPQAKTLPGRLKAEFKRKFAFFFPPTGNPHSTKPWKTNGETESKPRFMTLGDLKAREHAELRARYLEKRRQRS